MNIQFLCGCKTANVEAMENLKTMDSVKTDSDGMLICAIHNQRRVGWRSKGRDHSRDGLTDFEIEQQDLWGITPYREPVKVLNPAVEDRRDNRDPQEVARKMQIPHGSYERNLHREMDKAAAGDAARQRLDLWDRRGFEIRDAQVGG